MLNVFFAGRLLLPAALLALTGCAAVSEVVPTGRDTYMVASKGNMGYSSAGVEKAHAFEQAGAFCRSKGLAVEEVSSSTTDSGWGRIASAELHFRCADR